MQVKYIKILMILILYNFYNIKIDVKKMIFIKKQNCYFFYKKKIKPFNS